MRRCLSGWFILAVLSGCNTMPVDSKIPGYLTTPDGRILRNEDGQCWRTAAWRPALAIEECDPEIARHNMGRAVLPPLEEPVEEEARQQEEVSREEFKPQSPQELTLADASERAIEQSATRPLVLRGDASFHFGHHRLTPRGQRTVEYLAAAIKRRSTTDLEITIYGHTDRLGSSEANMELARRRGNTVRDAFIKAGLPPDSLRVVARGEQEPVTSPDDCPDDISRCELIVCLAPDRRVEISISGTQKVEPDRGRTSGVRPAREPAEATTPPPPD